MSKSKRPDNLPADLHWPTDKEEAEIRRGIAQDPDNPEWTGEDFKRARLAREVMPPESFEAIEKAKEQRRTGRPLSGDKPKVHIGLRLDADVVAGIRASGPGYNVRVEQVLRAALARGRFDVKRARRNSAKRAPRQSGAKR